MPAGAAKAAKSLWTPGAAQHGSQRCCDHSAARVLADHRSQYTLCTKFANTIDMKTSAQAAVRELVPCSLPATCMHAVSLDRIEHSYAAQNKSSYTFQPAAETMVVRGDPEYVK